MEISEEEYKRLLLENEKLRLQVFQLQDSLLWLRKRVFGKMSEKHLPIDPNQLSLFSDEELSSLGPEAKEESEKAEKLITKNVKVGPRPARRQLDLEHLPVETEDIYPEGTLDASGSLKEEYVEIGTETSRRLERVPAKLFVRRTVRHKVILKDDVSKKFPEERRIMIPDLPLTPVPKSMAGASVLADIIIGKFMYHLPFYRQIQQYKEAGIVIGSSTMGDWYEDGIDVLKPLYDRLRKNILSSTYVQIDESVVPVLDNEKHKATKGYEWCVRDGISGDVMFYYDGGSRAHSVARSILSGFQGTIQCDGYEAYDQFENKVGFTVCGCWAHTRRKYVDALDEDKENASKGILTIAKLYAVEEDCKDMSPEERAKVRQEKSYPVIKEFEKWIMELYPKVLPKSRIGKALAYTYSLLPRLSRYVNDGRTNIDNNLIENAIRPLAIGRKNYLFCGNDASAYRAAVAYSLIATCKSAGVEPRIWMEDVLCKIPYYQRDNKDLGELLPRNWRLVHTSS